MQKQCLDDKRRKIENNGEIIQLFTKLPSIQLFTPSLSNIVISASNSAAGSGACLYYIFDIEILSYT